MEIPLSNKKTPLISVLIPIFNGAKYLHETLNSLLRQNFREFEVLCIDDSSNDNSLEIIKAYAKKDNRVQVLTLESNKGCVPLVLNTVLDEIKGKYVVYSSQDDLFSTDWLLKMYSRALETGADATIPDLIFYYENDLQHRRVLSGLNGDRSAVLTGREAAQLSLNWTIPGNALWNSNLIKKIRFADFSFNADEYSTREFFFNCNKVVFCNGKFMYRQDNPDAITKKISLKSFDTAYTYFKLFLFFREKGYPFEVYGQEIRKAIISLQRMKTWLALEHSKLSKSEFDQAFSSIRRTEDSLKSHGIPLPTN
jgi:glycosyltransferase involved in cell wall biosynthesis